MTEVEKQEVLRDELVKLIDRIAFELLLSMDRKTNDNQS